MISPAGRTGADDEGAALRMEDGPFGVVLGGAVAPLQGPAPSVRGVGAAGSFVYAVRRATRSFCWSGLTSSGFSPWSLGPPVFDAANPAPSRSSASRP